MVYRADGNCYFIRFDVKPTPCANSKNVFTAMQTDGLPKVTEWIIRTDEILNGRMRPLYEDKRLR